MSLAARFARQALRAPPLRRRDLSSLAYAVSVSGGGGPSLSAQQLSPPQSVAADSVSLKWLAAGVDAIDFTKSARAAASGVCGTEGVAVVQEVGSGVRGLSVGDRVIPVKAGVGTWCEASVVPAASVAPVPSATRLEIAATLSASPVTAVCLLRSFGGLSAGDVVVQNCGSSAVGTAVVQIAAAMGLRTVSLVRERATDYAPTVERLKLMGGDVVIGEAHAKSAGFKAVMADLPKAKLGINGSPDAAACKAVMGLLGAEGTIVSYAPGVPQAAGSKKLKLKHEVFDVAEWLDQAERADVEKVVSELAMLVEEGRLTAWLQRVPFGELPKAVETGAPLRRKLVAIMDGASA